jgi:Skp family chaperone for outer membrane proteins
MGAWRGIFLGLTLALGLVAGGIWPGAALAQSLGRVVSPILTIDRDRLFTGSRYGQRVNRELEAASTAMAAETRKIEAGLEEEERTLTAQRATLAPDAFRALANAFDEKVQALRADRDATETNLRSQIEAAQLQFFEQVGPVLGAMLRERGAVMILDRRVILLTAADVDITDAAIARIDAVLGDGAAPDADQPDATAPAESDTPATPVDTIPAPAPAPEAAGTGDAADGQQ